MLRTWIKLGVGLAAGLAVLAIPAAWLLDTFAGGEYWMFEPDADAGSVTLEKAQWKAEHPDGKGGTDQEIVEIYGSPFSPERVVLASKDRIRHPDERPSISMLEVMKSKGENPLQAQTVYLVARYVAIAGAVAALLGIVLLRFIRKKPATG